MWKIALNKFVNKYKDDKDVEAIFLAGSYAVGNENKYSDIDVYIILNDNANYQERGNILVDDYLIEYFINPVYKIKEYMYNDKRGYGGAMATSYFRHSDYSNYLENPAFSYISEPYKGQWGMTVDYKVAVPEGGFVITAYDDSKVELLKHILSLSDVSPANANKQVHNVDNVRISFDETTGLITIVK
jgi:predicted nucleotidyltransferase